ncbi:MAG: hypothetical protein V2B20_13815 [Pseudomonadota bacterium]
MGNRVGPIDFDNISISPQYRVVDWVTARDSNPFDWVLATNIFFDRINGRFLKPIDLISSDKTINEFCGFSTMAIDCLLVETLYQFYNGIDETSGRHDMAFWKFFRESDFFKTEFIRRKAFIFYGHFRCGILHQAQTKNKSIIRINRDKMIEYVNPADPSSGLVVDRKRFHKAITDEISSYIDKLKSTAPENKNIQNNFIKKMNYICGS